MKKTIITALLAVGASVGVFAQGLVAFDNQSNTNLFAGAATSGAVIQGGALSTADFNLELWGGSTSSNMTVLATLLQSSGGIISGASAGAPGQWLDVSGASYLVNGVAIGGNAFLEVNGWVGGTGNSYAGAVAGGATFAGSSGIFVNPTGGGALPAAELVGMPSWSLNPTISPEPTTLALCGLGAASLLLFRRKKS